MRARVGYKIKFNHLHTAVHIHSIKLNTTTCTSAHPDTEGGKKDGTDEGGKGLRKNPTCYGCGSKEHLLWRCPMAKKRKHGKEIRTKNGNEPEGKTLTCFKCGSLYYYRKDCHLGTDASKTKRNVARSENRRMPQV